MAIRWPHREQLRSAIALAGVRPAYTLGLRAATVTVLPLLAGELLHDPALSWTAIGGWLSTLADPGGPYRMRAGTIAGFTAMAALLAALGTLAAGAPAWVGIAALFFVVLLSGLWRVRGDAAATVGVLLAVVFAIALGVPGIHAPPLAALLRAAHLLAGGVLTLLFSIGLWPFQPYRPARRALGACYRALADHADGLRALLAAGEARDEPWYELGRRDRPRARASLEQARSALAEIRRGRQGETDRGDRLLFLFELGDLLLGDLGALAESVRHLPGDASADLQRLLGSLSAALGAVAARIEDEKHPRLELAEGDRRRLELVPSPRPPRIDPLATTRLHTLTALDISAGLAPPAAGAPATKFEPPPPRPRLRDALDLRSELFRHALRLALATSCGAALGLALSARFALPRVPWLTITVMIVLQPQAGATLGRAVQRVGGTVLGGLAAALLAPISHHPLWYALVLFALSILAVALKPLNYGLFATLITPIFVLMAEQQAGAALVEARIVNTLLGGAVALLFGIVLWPSWERARLPAQLAALFSAAGLLLRAAIECPEDSPKVRRARRELGLSIANAEASFQRTLGEPHAVELQATMALLVGARRLAGLLYSLVAVPEDGQSAQAGIGATLASSPGLDRRQLERFSAVLTALSDAAARGAPPPPLPPEVSLDSQPSSSGEGPALLARIARQLALLHAAASRRIGSGSPEIA